MLLLKNYVSEIATAKFRVEGRLSFDAKETKEGKVRSLMSKHFA